MKDYYYILGISFDSHPEEIKKAYRKLSIKFHPDKNDGDKFFEERFKEINEAYETLIDFDKRKIYDDKLLKVMPKSREKKASSKILDPIIISFTCDKTEIYSGEQISLQWETQNATNVIIKPFGKVDLTGSKSYKINNLNKEELVLELTATNELSSTSKSLEISNSIFNDFKQKMNNENKDTKKTNISYVKEVEYTYIGIITGVVTIVFFLSGVMLANPITFSVFGLIARIFITVELIGVVKRQNRNPIFWSLLSFFAPSISLIVVGQLKMSNK